MITFLLPKKNFSPFLQIKPISSLCLLLGLCATTTPLQATQRIQDKIDHGLNIYYQSKEIYDYFDDNGKGKFSKFCQEDGFDTETIEEEFKGNIEDCSLLDFDDNFPLPKNNTSDQRTLIFNFIKELSKLEVSNLTEQQVKQIINNYRFKGKSDASSQIKFQEDKPRLNSNKEKKEAFDQGVDKKKLIAGYLRLGNARLYCKDLIELVLQHLVFPPTKIVGPFRIREENIQAISEQDFCDQFGEAQLDQHFLYFKKFLTIHRLTLPTSRHNIIKYKKTYGEGSYIHMGGFIRLYKNEGVQENLSQPQNEAENETQTEKEKHSLLGFVILYLGEEEEEEEDIDAKFSKEVFDEIGRMAEYAIRYKKKRFLCQPIFILCLNKMHDYLELRTLNIWTLYSYSNCIFVPQASKFGCHIKARIQCLFDRVKNGPYIAKYLQVQWLLNARDCLHYLIKDVLGHMGRSDEKDLEYLTVLGSMVDLLMNDTLDAKVLMEKFEQMKNNYNFNACGINNYNTVQLYLNNAIKEKGLS